MRGPRRFWRDSRGATVIEYGLICGLIFIAIFGSVKTFGGSLSTLLYNVSVRASEHLS